VPFGTDPSKIKGCSLSIRNLGYLVFQTAAAEGRLFFFALPLNAGCGEHALTCFLIAAAEGRLFFCSFPPTPSGGKWACEVNGIAEGACEALAIKKVAAGPG